jgi:hypothetical protein
MPLRLGARHVVGVLGASQKSGLSIRCGPSPNPPGRIVATSSSYHASSFPRQPSACPFRRGHAAPLSVFPSHITTSTTRPTESPSVYARPASEVFHDKPGSDANSESPTATPPVPHSPSPQPRASAPTGRMRRSPARTTPPTAALLELHKHKGIPYDPVELSSQDGFVFSKAQRVRRAPPSQPETVSRRTPFCAMFTGESRYTEHVLFHMPPTASAANAPWEPRAPDPPRLHPHPQAAPFRP